MSSNARALSKIETDLEGEFKREAASPIRIGRLLLKAKELLTEHGEWLTWLGAQFPARRSDGAALHGRCRVRRQIRHRVAFETRARRAL